MTQASSAGSTAAGDVATDRAGHSNKHLPMLVVGALGVVYGDIGTSPIYAFRQALASRPTAGATEAEILGLLSLIVWALTITVTVKYIFFVTRADNKGEGGTLSLVALARSGFAKRAGVDHHGRACWARRCSTATPSSRRRSRCCRRSKGINEVAPGLSPWVVPIVVVHHLRAVLRAALWHGQCRSVFGPVTAVWFLALGLPASSISCEQPSVLLALNPLYGVIFLLTHRHIALVVIGAVFLAVTGAEGLYVDLGHFGRQPIVIAWFALVFPCLLLNYFGQGAFVLGRRCGGDRQSVLRDAAGLGADPDGRPRDAGDDHRQPGGDFGTYSLTQQAIALNLLPRMTVLHTSETQSGQIYMPEVNTLLMVAVLMLVISFGSSGALSNAYGIAVSGVMLVTVALLAVVMWKVWRWHWVAIAVGDGAVSAHRPRLLRRQRDQAVPGRLGAGSGGDSSLRW